jgi:protein arginine kinase
VTLDELARSVSGWLTGTGPMSEIVISSRIRLARNLAGYPFLSRATESQRADIERRIREAIDKTRLAGEVFYVNVDDTDELDRLVLVERHLISRQHADAEGSRGVAISNRETVALMTNEEDHLRTQVLRSGMQLAELWEEINSIDDLLADHLQFAFHEQFGYLTACPTNAGTGIRVSVMLHLPALKITREIEKVIRAAQDMSLAVRGMHGEGTEATGDFFQVSNQITLGKSEEDLIKDFKDGVVPRIVEYEQQAREALLTQQAAALDDTIWRALGVLQSARVITAEECMRHLSHLRMGVHLGRLESIDLATVNELLQFIQPGHLQKLQGVRLSGEERGMVRAQIIRERLSNN